MSWPRAPWYPSRVQTISRRLAHGTKDSAIAEGALDKPLRNNHPSRIDCEGAFFSPENDLNRIPLVSVEHRLVVEVEHSDKECRPKSGTPPACIARTCGPNRPALEMKKGGKNGRSESARTARLAPNHVHGSTSSVQGPGHRLESLRYIFFLLRIAILVSCEHSSHLENGPCHVDPLAKARSVPIRRVHVPK